MWQVRSETRPRSYRSWLALVVLIPALIVGISACAGQNEPPKPQTIVDKGTPFDDLLVPKLTASVTDGAGNTSTTPIHCDTAPWWCGKSGRTAANSRRNSPNRATTNPKPISDRPVRTQASSVRSAARRTRGTVESV